MGDREDILNLLKNIRAEGRNTLTELESERILSSYGIPTTKGALVTSSKAAVDVAKEIGFPLVLKVVSPDILHKTEAKCVKVNLRDVENLKTAYHEILQNAKHYKPDAKIDGVLIQEMVQDSVEFIIGSTYDKTFGPTIMFGLGGIYVEVFKDISFRIIPINPKDAEEMVQEIKGFEILRGVRGRDPLNFNAVIDVLTKVSLMVEQIRVIKEIDINPLFVSNEWVKAADIRIILT